MNIFWKIIKNHRVFIGILILSILLRLYRLEILTTFGGDQGQDFLVVRDMVLYHKWTLLGIKTSLAPFFQGPIYLYMLFPFFLLFNLDPISGAIASVFVSIVIITLLYVLVSKNFSNQNAIWSCLLYAASPEFVRFGNTPLYQHFLPPFILLSLYLFLMKKRSAKVVLLIGVFAGLGIETHLLNFTLAVAFAIYFSVRSNQRFMTVGTYIVGLLIGIVPTLLFELRHQFLNTKLLISYLLENETSPSIKDNFGDWISGSARFLGGDSYLLGIFLLGLTVFALYKVKGSEQYAKLRGLTLFTFVICALCTLKLSAFGPHYVLPLWMILLIFIPFWMTQIFSKKTALFLLSTVVIINTLSSVVALNNNHGYYMPPGWTLEKIKLIGKIISVDSKTHPNFNVASILDGNTRTYPVRYATLYYGAIPNEVDHYPSDGFLYLVGRSDENIIYKSTVWEVSSLRPFTIGKQWNLKDDVFLYRLEREAK